MSRISTLAIAATLLGSVSAFTGPADAALRYPYTGSAQAVSVGTATNENQVLFSLGFPNPSAGTTGVISTTQNNLDRDVSHSAGRSSRRFEQFACPGHSQYKLYGIKWRLLRCCDSGQYLSWHRRPSDRRFIEL